jgi:acylphosphatase
LSLRHYNITVKGLVQGVSYRFATLRKAHKLSLTGYVKNLHNGDVFIEVEGKEENINKLIEWCYIGPPLAEVKELIAEEKELNHFRNFEIKK